MLHPEQGSGYPYVIQGAQHLTLLQCYACLGMSTQEPCSVTISMRKVCLLTRQVLLEDKVLR